MPLLEIWTATRESVLKMNLEAVVRIAGSSGHLKDGNDTSHEFRTYLQEVDSEKLAEYATYCIENAFTNSGQVLQDIVNEIGRRLGFNVLNGRYQGVRNDIGYDGIWSTPDVTLVVEVKTTDAYTIKLDTIAKYRERLIDEGRIPKDSPILLVIGRNDTQSLEAQVRGSRHAWSMRIIGIDALIKLMDVNVSTSSKEVTEKIHTILQPFEYTRLDAIVDVMFAAAEDKEVEAIEPDNDPIKASDTPIDVESKQQDRTSKEILAEKKARSIASLSTHIGKNLVKRKHSLYSDPSNEVHAVATVSKRYERSEDFYWYAYHDEPHRSFLKEAHQGFMLFAMVDTDFCFSVPLAVLDDLWDRLYETVRENGKVYKHIQIFVEGDKYHLRTRQPASEVDLSPYKIQMKT